MEEANIGECEQLLKNINDKVNQLFTDFETFSNALETVFNDVVKIQENQVKISEAIVKVNQNILKNGEISLANNKYLKDIQYSRGALPDEVLTQIANIEAVSKGLNSMLLGGNNG